MKNVAIVYFSGYGHTKKIAEHIKIGIEQLPNVYASLLSVDEIHDVDALNDYEAIIFGAPTYMGSVPYQFKKFMDDASKIWLKQGWKNKLAAGFTNSGALSGDKFNVLMQLCTFACQQGMLWLSLGVDNTSNQGEHTSGHLEALNRMGGSLGLMTQSENDIPEVTPPSGDKRTAELFGQRIAEFVLRLN
ncbi:flavodoxin family protein [Fangia hongkongensis]|uniref:flavodoxin family protein n=1 Tax=Fangia hongkongensis TaxID=270495 RepID=UPI00036E7B7F|nr:flavodoxin family protein [Fangia hongkongensis]MBK2124864.1 flavodoxin family protein [Fangia hongkongensis]